MARARNIKPGFFKNEELVELSFADRLLFIGLWTLADRRGKLEDRPKRIKMELFPADDMDTDAALDRLADIGVITRYEADGQRVIRVTNFGRHQKPHSNEAESELPNEDGSYEKEASTSDQGSKSSRQGKKSGTPKNKALGPDSLIPDSLNSDSLNPDCSGKRAADATPRAKRAHQLPDDFEPTEKHRALAGELGVILIDEFAKFRDYHRAKGSTMKDWNAALNTWLRNAKDFQRGKTSGPPGGSHETPRERAIRMAREQGIPYDPQ